MAMSRTRNRSPWLVGSAAFTFTGLVLCALPLAAWSAWVRTRSLASGSAACFPSCSSCRSTRRRTATTRAAGPPNAVRRLHHLRRDSHGRRHERPQGISLIRSGCSSRSPLGSSSVRSSCTSARRARRPPELGAARALCRVVQISSPFCGDLARLGSYSSTHAGVSGALGDTSVKPSNKMQFCNICATMRTARCPRSWAANVADEEAQPAFAKLLRRLEEAGRWCARAPIATDCRNG